MLRNYLAVAARNIRRHPGFSVINVLGLGLGVAAALVILLFVRNELTVDAFHENAERIHMVYKERATPTGTQATYDTWVPLLERMKATLPGIETGTRTNEYQAWVQTGNRKFQDPVMFADAAFFDVFTFPLQSGNDDDPLPALASAVVSPAIAEKYFGDADPIGRTLTVDYETEYTVSGVLEAIPENATVRPEIIVRIETMSSYAEDIEQWESSYLETYVLLEESTSAASLQALFPQFVTDIWDAEVATRTHFKLLPLLDAYDTFTGSREYAYILLAIALATILIAGINFVNLATARSLERAREVGMRKVLGARRANLVRQFLGESVILGLASVLVGVAMAELALPWFNDLYGTSLGVSAIGGSLTVLWVAAFGVTIGILAGLYPALFLSGFGLVRALRGALKSSPRGLRLRQGLVVVQFTLSIALIAGTIVMIDQVRFMKDRDLGFDDEHVLVVPIGLDDYADPEEAQVRLETFKDALRQRTDVDSATSSSHVPGRWAGSFTFARPEGGDPDQPLRVRWSFMDHAYFDTYGIEFIGGRPFMQDSETDAQESMIVNRAALEDFGWESSDGRTVTVGGRAFNVVGVVENYHYASLAEVVAPIMHFFRPEESGIHSYVSIRFRAGDTQEMIASMGELWTGLDPTRTFEPFFADDNFNTLYEAQDRLTSVATAFSVLAILIAGLGLFGLASLTVVQRTKEIGVRKVLGASVSSIALLLSKDFARLVLVALVLATPIVLIALNGWLDGFVYRTNVDFGTIVFAGFLALLVSIATVSYQAIRAALLDPVECVRDE